jgi:glycosyltransferase involved in cell wall biosynthesis
VKQVLVYSAQMEPIGGIESHVVEFCLQLARADHRVTLMSSRFALNGHSRECLVRAGVELRVNDRRWSSSSAPRKWLWTMWTLLRLLRKRFDVVYTNGQGRNSATVHAWFRGRLRLVHHHHTSCDSSDVASWPSAYIDTMRRADVLVVCADYIRARMQAAIGRRDVEAVYCFSRQSPTSPARLPRRPVVFGYFGRLIREKGIDWILRLSDEPRLKDITWKIWGVEATYRARDFEGRANVQYRGSFSSEDALGAALDALDCFCLFSTHPEGVPVSLIEVMGAGKPWIATAQGGIPELVHDPESCVIVSLNDYEDVVAACLAMCNRIRSEKVDRSRQQAFYRSRFSRDALLPHWMRLLGSNA